MKLADNPALDALCGEYLLGTLRGAARRRFERALREEPRLAARLEYWSRVVTPRFSDRVAMTPSARTWKRLERELGLARYRTPWHRRLGVWRALAAASVAALAITLGLQWPQVPTVPPAAEIAQLEGKTEAARVSARLTPDRGTLELVAARPVQAGPAQSYELWLLPAEGGAPLSLAVLGSLDTRVKVAPPLAQRLVRGAKLAISVEPAGGSPTGAPTGPVILAGEIRT